MNSKIYLKRKCTWISRAITWQFRDNYSTISNNYLTITRQLLNIIRGGEMLLLLLVVPLKYYYYWTLLNPVSINSDDIDHHRRPWRACSPERGLGTTIDNRQLAISTIIIWYNETRVIHLIILGSTTRTMTNGNTWILSTTADDRRRQGHGPGCIDVRRRRQPTPSSNGGCGAGAGLVEQA